MQAQMEFGAPGGSVTRTDAGPALPAGMDPAQYARIMAQIYAQMPKPAASSLVAARPRASTAGTVGVPGGRTAPGSAPVTPYGGANMQDTYYVPVGEGIQSTGLAYQAWSPGMPFNPAHPPVYSGSYDMGHTLNVKPEKATGLDDNTGARIAKDRADQAAHDAWEAENARLRAPVTTSNS